MSNIYTYISKANKNLSGNEKVIRDYILNNFDHNIQSTQIGKQMYISPSSVSRYLKKIKYKNIKQLNNDIKNEHMSFEFQLQQIANQKKKIIDQSIKLIDEEQIKQVSELLINANTIYVYGLGYSKLEVQNIQLRLSRIGFNVILLNNRHDIMTFSHQKQVESSICLVISQSGQTSEVIDVVEFLKNIKVEIIAITSDNNSKLAKLVNNIILTPKIYSGYKLETIYSEVSTSVILDAIYFYILSSNYEYSITSYERSKDLLNLKL